MKKSVSAFLILLLIVIAGAGCFVCYKLGKNIGKEAIIKETQTAQKTAEETPKEFPIPLTQAQELYAKATEMTVNNCIYFTHASASDAKKEINNYTEMTNLHELDSVFTAGSSAAIKATFFQQNGKTYRPDADQATNMLYVETELTPLISTEGRLIYSAKSKFVPQDYAAESIEEYIAAGEKFDYRENLFILKSENDKWLAEIHVLPHSY